MASRSLKHEEVVQLYQFRVGAGFMIQMCSISMRLLDSLGGEEERRGAKKLIVNSEEQEEQIVLKKEGKVRGPRRLTCLVYHFVDGQPS